MNVLRRKGSVEMCAACGIRYNEDQSYAVDTSYLKDCGVAYLQVCMTRMSSLPIQAQAAIERTRWQYWV